MFKTLNSPKTSQRYLTGVAAAVMAQVAFAPAAALAEGGRKNVTLLGIPSATVAPGGLAFASISGTTRRDGTGSDADGSAAFGLGFGSAEDGIGLQFTTYVTSLTNDLGDSGYFGLKFSRRIAAGSMPTYLGVSVEHLGNWGDASGQDVSGSIALTSFTQLSFGPQGDTYPVMMTLGAGSHQRNNQTDPGVFFGAGIGLTPNFGTSIAWTGETVDIGASFRFDGLDNLGFTATLNDALDQKNSQRVTFTLSWFLQDAFGR